MTKRDIAKLALRIAALFIIVEGICSIADFLNISMTLLGLMRSPESDLKEFLTHTFFLGGTFSFLLLISLGFLLWLKAEFFSGRIFPDREGVHGMGGVPPD